MARRWWYSYQAEVVEEGRIELNRYVWARKPQDHYATQAAALALMSRNLEDEVRQRLNQIDAIRAGKVTRTWEAKRK